MSTAALSLDTLPIAAGASEELAGPPHIPAPVTRQERISSIDTLRGVALLGILAMNITDFGLPSWDYAVPLSTVHPVFSGPHSLPNTAAWFIRWIFFEGKMRGLFSMLFGAGAILLTARAEARGAGERTADIFTRRNMWLMLFGMLHCYLIWNGDILFFYGLYALIFLYPMRKLKPRTLFIWAAVVLILNGAVLTGGQLASRYSTRKKAIAADQLYRQGKPLTEEQSASIKDWHDAQDRFRPSDKKLYDDIKAAQKNYLSAQAKDLKDAFQGETIGAYVGFGDILGFMLLGMALYRNGFLTGELRKKNLRPHRARLAGHLLAIDRHLLLHRLEEPLRHLHHHLDAVRPLRHRPRHGSPRQRRPRSARLEAWLAEGPYPLARRRRPDGALELPLHQHLLQAALRLGSAPLVRLHGVLQAVLRHGRRLGLQPPLEPHLAALLPVRPRRVGLALAYLLEAPTHADQTRRDPQTRTSRRRMTLVLRGHP